MSTVCNLNGGKKNITNYLSYINVYFNIVYDFLKMILYKYWHLLFGQF